MAANETGSKDLHPIAGIDRLIHEPARLMVMTYLYVVESADFLFLMRQTGLTAGNLSSHTSKLEAAGYIEVVKEFVDRKPHTMLRLTGAGRDAFREYREGMMQVLGGDDCESNGFKQQESTLRVQINCSSG